MNYNSFINEFLQCLANIEQFKKFYLNNEKEIIDKNKNFSALSNRFINTLKFIFNMEYDRKKLINDKFFEYNYNNPNKSITSIMEFFFNKFKKELKDVYIDNKIIEKYFYGKKSIICQCANCNYPKIEVEYFFYIKFNINKVFEFYKNKNNNLKSISLKDCFNYNKDKYDNFICTNCKKNEYKNYSYIISKLPEIIILFIENVNNNLIINKVISNKSIIQENINNNNKENYILINRINIGKNNEYNTYLRFYENLNWYECKEKKIIECNKEKIENGIPFVLMYQRVDFT